MDQPERPHDAQPELRRRFLDSGAYFSILQSQFAAIETFLKVMDAGPNDLVVFDIDETCLLNLMYTDPALESAYDLFDRREFNFTNQLTPLIPECRGVFRVLQTRGIRYAFITGRRDAIRQLTELNLDKVGLDNYVALHTCPDDYRGSMKDFKTQCRYELESRGYRVVCTIGDQLTDVAGPYAGQRFLLCNPFYSVLA